MREKMKKVFDYPTFSKFKGTQTAFPNPASLILVFILLFLDFFFYFLFFCVFISSGLPKVFT